MTTIKSSTSMSLAMLDHRDTSSEPVFRLTDIFKPSFDLWVISWMLGVLFSLSMIGLLMISGWFITGAALAGMIAVGSHTFNYLMPAAMIRMLAIARTASRYGELMVAHNAIFDLLKTLRVRFFNGLASLPLMNQRNALQASQTMHRLVSDIDTLDEFILRVISPWLISSITLLLLALFIGFALPIALTFKLILYSLLTLALLVPLGATFFGIKQARVLAQLSEARRDKLLAPLAIITQLILWQQWQAQTKAFVVQDNRLHDLQWQVQKHRSLCILIIQWIFYLTILMVIFAILMIDNTYISTQTPLIIKSLTVDVPLVLATILGLMGVQEIVVPLGQHYLSLGNSVSAKERLNELLHLSKDIDHSTIQNNTQSYESSLLLPTGELMAKLDKVSTKMPKALIGAKEVSVTIQSGIPLLIGGTSGCGKSTLLKMLAGEVALLSGKVTLNGLPWHDYDWRDQLGYLGQQLDIFDQSLAANLRLGRANASDKELMDALNKVGLTQWLQAQPQGLATALGEYGIAVSGGQARRIALARLLLKRRRVLLLDEPFAGLDSQTREQLWCALKEHQKNDLLIVVSHHQWDMGVINTLTLKQGVLG